jgi:integrase
VNTVRGLNHQLKQLCRQNRDGSYGTQVRRERELTLVANQLHELGYRGMNSHSLKPKHVQALVGFWLSTGVAIGALKNRMSALRWWARKVNRQNVVARSNDAYGIPNRQFVTGQSKARSVSDADLEKINDPHIRMSLALQAAFGLRREEAIKFSPSYADQGDHLELKASWTKGGKARSIPIRSPLQRAVLDRAHELAGKGSLIPGHRNYRQQLRIYEGQTIRAGLSRLHGLRHAYAQRRYEELTGWTSPAAGGPPAKSFSAEQRSLDEEARLTISRELGHERISIVRIYIG